MTGGLGGPRTPRTPLGYAHVIYVGPVHMRDRGSAGRQVSETPRGQNGPENRYSKCPDFHFDPLRCPRENKNDNSRTTTRLYTVLFMATSVVPIRHRKALQHQASRQTDQTANIQRSYGSAGDSISAKQAHRPSTVFEWTGLGRLDSLISMLPLALHSYSLLTPIPFP